MQSKGLYDFFKILFLLGNWVNGDAGGGGGLKSMKYVLYIFWMADGPLDVTKLD